MTVEGMAYHVLNRRVMRMPLFQQPGDYEAFQRIMAQGLRRPDAPLLLGWCLMPNHWHLLLMPKPSGQRRSQSNLSTWMQWLTVTHTHRWHQHYHTVGQGPLYQGRFKSFPIQEDLHLLRALRYVEANALRAKLAERAQQWRWSSLWVRLHGPPEQRAMLGPLPIALPVDWTALVNEPQPDSELNQVRRAVVRGSPLGQPSWVDQVVKRLGLQGTLRPRGRPRKPNQADRNRIAVAVNSS
jgi:putative transposase